MAKKSNKIGYKVIPIGFKKTHESKESTFFKEVMEDGYHIYSLMNAKTPGYYPNPFPDYPGVPLSELVEVDIITIRAFFKVGTKQLPKIDGGLIELEVEFVVEDHIMGSVITKLPPGFAIETGSSVEIRMDEILYKSGSPGSTDSPTMH